MPADWKKQLLVDIETGAMAVPLALDLAYAQGRRDQRDTYITIDKQHVGTVAAFEAGLERGIEKSAHKIAMLMMELSEARAKLELHGEA